MYITRNECFSCKGHTGLNLNGTWSSPAHTGRRPWVEDDPHKFQLVFGFSLPQPIVTLINFFLFLITYKHPAPSSPLGAYVATSSFPLSLRCFRIGCTLMITFQNFTFSYSLLWLYNMSFNLTFGMALII